MSLYTESTTYCQVDHPEDGLVIEHTGPHSLIAAVFDGVSGFHSPTCPNRMFEGPRGGHITGGLAVVHILKRTLTTAPSTWPLTQKLTQANNLIAQWATKKGISLEEADNLPGAHAAAIQIGSTIELVQTGDSLVIAGRGKELQLVTPNTEWEFGQYEIPRQQALLAQYGSRGEMWTHIEPQFRQWRRGLTNVRYPTFNGQDPCTKLWYTANLRLSDVDLLLTLTDGLIEDEYLHKTDMHDVAARILSAYREGGWPAVVALKGADSIREGTGIAVHIRI